jgi:hypothetical protein
MTNGVAGKKSYCKNSIFQFISCIINLMFSKYDNIRAISFYVTYLSLDFSLLMDIAKGASKAGYMI